MLTQVRSLDGLDFLFMLSNQKIKREKNWNIDCTRTNVLQYFFLFSNPIKIEENKLKREPLYRSVALDLQIR